MVGEGYDWHPLYSVRSGPMVGALSVGIETKGFADAPYWPTQNCWTYKEVWVQPVGQWIWLMDDISVPAMVHGTAEETAGPVKFREQKTGQMTTAAVDPDSGEFSVRLPEGHYDVKQGSAHTSLTVLPGGNYVVDLRSDSYRDFKVTSKDLGNGEIELRVSAEGAGRHAFVLRTDNLAPAGPLVKMIDLASGGTEEVVWREHVISPKTPWVAVVVPSVLPGGARGQFREITGVEKQASPLHDINIIDFSKTP
jgi:hypothetical protein